MSSLVFSYKSSVTPFCLERLQNMASKQLMLGGHGQPWPTSAIFIQALQPIKETGFMPLWGFTECISSFSSEEDFRAPWQTLKQTLKLEQGMGENFFEDEAISPSRWPLLEDSRTRPEFRQSENDGENSWEYSLPPSFWATDPELPDGCVTPVCNCEAPLKL